MGKPAYHYVPGKVLAERSRWLMGSFLDRCGIAPAIAAILAPTSLALFPWNVPIVLDIQFSRSRKYFLLYTPNMKFSLLVVTHFLRVACKPAAAQRGLGRAPKISVWISKRYASKTYWAGKVLLCIPFHGISSIFTAIGEHLPDLYHRHTIFVPPGYFSCATIPFATKPPYQLWYF